MGILKIFNGATWDVAIGKIWDGAAWKEKMNFFDGSVQVPLYPSVELLAGNGGTVLVTDNSSPYDSIVGIRFLTDGSVQVLEAESGSGPWVAHGNWIDDVGEITGDEEVRFTNSVIIQGPGDFNVEAAAEDAWIDISATRMWTMARSAPGESDFTCDFEVRDIVTPRDTASVGYRFRIDNVI